MDPPPATEAKADSQYVLPAPQVSHEPRWDAEQLLQGSKEAIIVLGQSIYRLRLTRSGKLILYK